MTQPPAARPRTARTIAFVGAGMIAAAPVVAPVPTVQIPDISIRGITVQLLSAADVTIDFIRHGESLDNVASLIGTLPPGAALTDAGRQQALDIVSKLGVDGGTKNGVFASEFLRAQQTAWPLLESLTTGTLPAVGDIPATVGGTEAAFASGNILAGLNEINAGILDKSILPISLGRVGEILYILPPFLWTLGLPIVPEWGSTVNFNGVVFNDTFTGAVDYIADQVGDGGHAVAFSHAASIMAWTQMNVNNPDPLLMFLDPLSNTSQVVVTGGPDVGWTLESWNGTPVAAANLWQDLFVNTRDLMVAPQTALTHLAQAVISLDPDNILATLQSGLTDVVKTTLGYPGAMITDIIQALQGNLMQELGIDTLMQMLGGLGGGGLLPLDLAGLVPDTGGDLLGLLPAALLGLF